MKAVKQTLDERCNETIEEIYKIAIKLIIETIAEGYGEDDGDERAPARDDSGGSSGDKTQNTGDDASRPSGGGGTGSSINGAPSDATTNIAGITSGGGKQQVNCASLMKKQTCPNTRIITNDATAGELKNIAYTTLGDEGSNQNGCQLRDARHGDTTICQQQHGLASNFTHKNVLLSKGEQLERKSAYVQGGVGNRIANELPESHEISDGNGPTNREDSLKATLLVLKELLSLVSSEFTATTTIRRASSERDASGQSERAGGDSNQSRSSHRGNKKDSIKVKSKASSQQQNGTPTKKGIREDFAEAQKEENAVSLCPQLTTSDSVKWCEKKGETKGERESSKSKIGPSSEFHHLGERNNEVPRLIMPVRVPATVVVNGEVRKLEMDPQQPFENEAATIESSSCSVNTRYHDDHHNNDQNQAVDIPVDAPARCRVFNEGTKLGREFMYHHQIVADKKKGVDYPPLLNLGDSMNSARGHQEQNLQNELPERINNSLKTIKAIDGSQVQQLHKQQEHRGSSLFSSTLSSTLLPEATQMIEFDSRLQKRGVKGTGLYIVESKEASCEKLSCHESQLVDFSTQLNTIGHSNHIKSQEKGISSSTDSGGKCPFYVTNNTLPSEATALMTTKQEQSYSTTRQLAAQTSLPKPHLSDRKNESNINQLATDGHTGLANHETEEYGKSSWRVTDLYIKTETCYRSGSQLNLYHLNQVNESKLEIEQALNFNEITNRVKADGKANLGARAPKSVIRRNNLNDLLNVDQKDLLELIKLLIFSLTSQKREKLTKEGLSNVIVVN